jgi:glycosyltransferase involved in cell wall biosynthesis
MTEGLPRITVVTPSFNQASFLEETILSVLGQGYPDLEYMITDGGSTDGSGEIIRRHEAHLAYWVSEPDQGQYHALQKGFARATGELLGWLNSDDLYLPDALMAVGRAYAEHPGTCVAGPVLNLDMRSGREETIHQHGINFENLVQFWQLKYGWHQPGFFFPRSAYELVGGMNGSLSYAMDYDLVCRLLQGHSVTYVPEPLAKFRLHDTSKTCTMARDMLMEVSSVSRRYWPLLESVDPAQHDRFVAERLAGLALRTFRRRPGEACQLLGESVRLCPTAIASGTLRVTKRWISGRPSHLLP